MFATQSIPRPTLSDLAHDDRHLPPRLAQDDGRRGRGRARAARRAAHGSSAGPALSAGGHWQHTRITLPATSSSSRRRARSSFRRAAARIMKFSFDFPEPSVAFGDYRFGFLVFTDENTYGLDRAKMRVDGSGDALRLICDGFVWAGGQEKAPGQLAASLRRTGTTIEWDVVAEMDRPIKTVTIDRARRAARPGVVRRRRVHRSARRRVLVGYPFGGGDLQRRRGEHDDAAADGAGAAERRRLHLVARRPRAAQALLSPARRDELSRRGHLRARRLAQRHSASQMPAWRLGTRRRPTKRDATHMAPSRARVQPPDLGVARRRARLDAQHRDGHDAARHALHGLHLQRLREAARDPALDGDADSRPSACSCFSRRGTAATTGIIPTTKSSERMGGDAGFQAARQRGPEARLQDDADVRHELGEREAPVWSTIADGAHAQDRRQRVQSELGRLEQRPSPGRLARLHEPRRRFVAQASRGRASPR